MSQTQKQRLHRQEARAARRRRRIETGRRKRKTDMTRKVGRGAYGWVDLFESMLGAQKRRRA